MMNRMIFVNAVSIICIISALVLAVMEKDGWGWFLFVGVICFTWLKDFENETH